CLRFYMFYGNTFKVECPTGSGEYMHLGHVAEELQHRLQHLMARNGEGRRAYNDGRDMLDFGPDWKDNLWFYEFFDGDTGRGLGASHQCGWTGLMAKMIHDTGVNCRLPQTPRTPTTAAAHYFDDVFSRQRRASLGGGSRRPSGPARSVTRKRSIGARSDWSQKTNGDADDDEDFTSHPPSRTWSIYKDDDPNVGIPKPGEDPDDPINRYVHDQLERIKRTESQEYADELAAQNDGASDQTGK
ncbi:hypothetical protein KC317_g11289, partial [Hortaea werneckii]